MLLVGAVAYGALNTGNNLLYLLLSAMLSLLVLSVVLAELALRGVEIWRTPPPEIYAGQETFVALGVRNRKRRLPSLNLAVRESFGRGRVLDPVSFTYLSPNQEAMKGYRCIFPRRGRCRFRGWVLETSFPLGLVVKGRDIDGPERALVYPELHQVQPPILLHTQGAPEASPTTDPPPPTHNGQHSGGDEFFDLRTFRDGDDRRRIAWKASARRGQTLLRGFEATQATAFELSLLDLSPNRRQEPLLETAISYTASLAMYYLSLGYPVGLTTLRLRLPASNDPSQRQRLLAALSTLRQTPPDDPDAANLVSQLSSTLASFSAQRVLVSTSHADEFASRLPTDAHIRIDHPELLSERPEPTDDPTFDLITNDTRSTDSAALDTASLDSAALDIVADQPQ